MTLLHAKIEIEGQEERPIRCTFNPDKLTYTKNNTWTPQPATGRHLPPMGFSPRGEETSAQSSFQPPS